MSIKKYEKDLINLKIIAKKQMNKINLSIILITTNCKNYEVQELVDYFTKMNIEVINDDIEPDSEDDINDAYSQNIIDNIVKPFDPSKIDIKMDKLTIDSIIKRIRHEELELNSSFQRKAGLWNKKQKSQLIESILLRIPLPAFYFDASNDDRWLIIDGLQRISTIKEFVVDESFALTGMEFLKDLNALKYSALPRSLQRRVEETNINAYLVSPDTPKNVKFNIFKRINTGGLILESQEIRNALFQGQATEFLNNLSQEPSFIKATDNSIKPDRMLDREFCLRYIAFTELPIESYANPMDNFLNRAMDYLSTVNKSQLKLIRDEFKQTMNTCYSIFGKNAFRKIFEDKKRRPVNKALYDAWSYTIKNLDKNSINILTIYKSKLIELFMQLCKDNSFQSSLSSSNKKSLLYRLEKIKNIVDIVITGGIYNDKKINN